jgi:hypothetical protein
MIEQLQNPRSTPQQIQAEYTQAMTTLFRSIFTGVSIVGVPGDWSAEYQGHLVSDSDIFKLMNKVWEANS